MRSVFIIVEEDSRKNLCTDQAEREILSVSWEVNLGYCYLTMHAYALIIYERLSWNPINYFFENIELKWYVCCYNDCLNCNDLPFLHGL